MQAELFQQISEILRTHPHANGLDEGYIELLVQDAAESAASVFFSKKYDYLKTQDRARLSAERERIEREYMQRVEAERNVSLADFKNEVLNRLNELVMLKNDKKYLLDKYCVRSIELLLTYFVPSAETALNRKKPVWLAGPIGAGKSTIMRGFSLNPFRSYITITAQEIVDEYKNNPNFIEKLLFGQHTITPNKYGQDECDILIEEVGREQLSVNVNKESFKNEPVNVMQVFFTKLYDANTPHRFHVCSNADIYEKWTDLYDKAVASRIGEMYNVIAMASDAPDRRRVL